MVEREGGRRTKSRQVQGAGVKEKEVEEEEVDSVGSYNECLNQNC